MISNVYSSLSIVVPARNEEQFIAGLLESLTTHLQIPYEICVVLNGSDDATEAIVKRTSAQMLNFAAALKPGEARNAGVAATRGELVVFLDADVVITPEWAQALAEIYRGFSELPDDFVTGDTYDISQNPSWIERHWFAPMKSQPKSYLNGGNIVTTRRVLERLGGFNPNLETAEDVDFSRRAGEIGVPVIFDERFRSFHEGYPKRLRDFIRREAWHGKTDFSKWAYFLGSKIALLTAVFISLHLALLVSLVWSLGDFSPGAWGMLITSTGIFFVTVVRLWAGFKRLVVRHFLPQLVISYAYLLGRSLAALRSLRS